jgi:farnesyl-diphosphate farnesyltransferase
MASVKTAAVAAAVLVIPAFCYAAQWGMPGYGETTDFAIKIATLALVAYPAWLLIFMARIGRQPVSGTEETEKALAAKNVVKEKKRSKAEKVVELVTRPSELVAAVRIKLGAMPSRSIPAPPGCSDQIKADVAFCDDMLTKVSRSFSAVIRQLPDELCLAVCVFYLVLRALDTVEDETDLSKFECAIKKASDGEVQTANEQQCLEAQRGALRTFFALHPAETEATRPDVAALAEGGVGKDAEARLLQEYDRVIRIFRSIPEAQQVVIQDICEKMGVGMAEYLGRDLGAGTKDLADYNRYCHIVAGLVGEGLTRLFYVSGVERFAKEGSLGMKALDQGEGALASDMGLFLQKTNIIRDYLEDLHDGRSFWPRSVWSQHGKCLADLAKLECRADALACLNKLVFNALELAPRCLAYLECLEDPDVFAFCAVPQVMAIMTLAELFGNENVFTGVVKIRKGLAAKIMLNTGDIRLVRSWFARGCRELSSKMKVAARDTVPARAAEVLTALEVASTRLCR